MAPPTPIASIAELLDDAGWIRRLARSLVDAEHGAEDVAQQTLLAALRRAPKDPKRLGPWLVRVARNAARTWKRRDERVSRRERTAARPETIPSAAESVARVALQRSVADAVLALDEP